jgi:hypothetical protein
MKSETIPIALIAYKRIEHLKQTIEGLKRNKVPLIFAFIDGPKDESEVEQVKGVLNLVNSIDWCEVKINYLEKNIGLGNNIRRGVSEVLENFNYGIILEDDIVMRPGAYEFMKKAITNFDGNDQVASISMWNHPTFGSGKYNTGFYSKRFVCWGWSSSNDFWKKYCGNPEQMYKQVLDQKINYFPWGRDLTLQIQLSQERNLWYAGYAMTHFLYNKLTYFPPETLVINIGRDETAQNSKNGLIDDKTLINIPVKQISTFPEISIPVYLPGRFKNYFDNKNIPFYLRLSKKIVNRVSKIFSLR